MDVYYAFGTKARWSVTNSLGQVTGRFVAKHLAEEYAERTGGTVAEILECGRCQEPLTRHNDVLVDGGGGEFCSYHGLRHRAA